MKSLNDLLDDLVEELSQLSKVAYSYDGGDVSFTKALQLIGYIRAKLKEEQWKPR